MISPAYASTPPHSRHDESSKDGCRTKNRSSTGRTSSVALNRALRAASRCNPATSQSRPKPTSSRNPGQGLDPPERSSSGERLPKIRTIGGATHQPDQTPCVLQG